MTRKSYHVRITQLEGLWVAGTIDDYGFEAKVYDNGSPFGIDKGRVCKLTISTSDPSHEVVGYERGWDTYPETRELEDLLEALLKFCNSLPPYEKRVGHSLVYCDTVTLERDESALGLTHQITLDFQVTGTERKELVTALSNIIHREAVYQGAPTFSYKVGNYMVDKDGILHCPELVDQNHLDEILEKLRKQGFEPVYSDNTLTIELPRSLYDDGAIFRLEQIISNKEPLFKRAFKAEAVSVVKQEDKLCFPWFTLTGDPNEAKAYSEFILATARMAREQKRVIPQVYAGNNDKYAMRLFLVRLGLKGKEYKETRKILMRNLTGNGAWRDGVPPERARTQSEEDVD